MNTVLDVLYRLQHDHAFLLQFRANPMRLSSNESDGSGTH